MFALKNSGYAVEEFENAKSFFSKTAEKVPDLVLLDIMLPDMDGLEIVKKLRSRPETACHRGYYTGFRAAGGSCWRRTL